jgi:tetratricopeptide (TPR) repeat protein
MLSPLRPLLLMFYAPTRAMREARDRAPLLQAVLIAVLADFARSSSYLIVAPVRVDALRGIVSAGSILIYSIMKVLFVAVLFIPITIFVANLIERHGSFGVALQQDYAPAASSILYAWAAANLVAVPLTVIAQTSGLFELSQQLAKQGEELGSQLALREPGAEVPAGAYSILWKTAWLGALMVMLSPVPYFAVWTVVALRTVFRLSWVRSVVTLAISGLLLIVAAALISKLRFLSSPFLIIMLFFVLRGYFAEVMRTQRARASFKQNLEASTLNPADASAHYNLGLIHQQRNEFDAARQRFERAVEIDPDELDAHYQLGRIARAENRLADAIRHFEQVVARDQSHAQNEIWREIGATYLAAGQYEDAREALERFLDRRQSDPEALYLMGRAHAGLGHRQEAASSMQACIEAVKTAPAYKYRTEKRWLNEARQFIKSSQ